MTDSEREQILKMIDDGKISAEQGLTLMQALGGEPDDEPLAELPLLEPQVLSGFASQAQAEPASKPDPQFESKLRRYRSLWVIPLWAGVALTVTGAYWMYAAWRSAGLGFWFYFAWLPFLLGVALTSAAFASRTSRWIYVNIKQAPDERPQRIMFAFPLSLVSWGLNFARHKIPQAERGAAEEVMRAVFESSQSDQPLMVDVNEKDGKHVQIYIG